VAKFEGDGWLSLKRWVAKFEGNGWLNLREMGWLN
jgi:hypothetical protein